MLRVHLLGIGLLLYNELNHLIMLSILISTSLFNNNLHFPAILGVYVQESTRSTVTRGIVIIQPLLYFPGVVLLSTPFVRRHVCCLTAAGIALIFWKTAET